MLASTNARTPLYKIHAIFPCKENYLNKIRPRTTSYCKQQSIYYATVYYAKLLPPSPNNSLENDIHGNCVFVAYLCYELHASRSKFMVTAVGTLVSHGGGVSIHSPQLDCRAIPFHTLHIHNFRCSENSLAL